MKEKNGLKQMGVRLAEERTLYSLDPVGSVTEAVRVIAAEFGCYDREVFGIVNMDNRMRIINFGVISIGGNSSAAAEPACCIRHSLLSGATRVLLFHTHTSGVPEPSECDCEVTQRFIDAYHLMGMEMCDHIIIGKNSYYSFRQEETLKLSERKNVCRPEKIAWQMVAEENSISR